MQKYVVLPELESRVYEIPDELLDYSQKSVLIVEDDATLATLLKEELESRGYRVTVAPNGAEGVQQILASDFDVIACDMVMPNFPGDMFYLAVQRSRPHLCQRFVFITGHQHDPKIVKFIKQTGCMALWKPFETRQLLDAIESVTRVSWRSATAESARPSSQTEPSGNWNFTSQPSRADVVSSR